MESPLSSSGQSAIEPSPNLHTRRLGGRSELRPAMQRWLFDYAPAYYLLLLAVAELLIATISPQLGLALHIALLIVLPIHYAFAQQAGVSVAPLLLSLTLAPLIRIMSLTLPLAHLPLMSWYLIIAVPIFAAGIVVAYTLNIGRRSLGFTISWRGLPVQLAIGLSGVALGVCEYLILHPAPLVNREYAWQMVFAGIALLIGTGLLEEFIFRGVMQQATIRAGIKGGPFYINLVFAAMHIGYLSLADLLFVFAVGLFFSWAVKKTGSLAGVVIAHSLTNIVLYLFMPATGGLVLP